MVSEHGSGIGHPVALSDLEHRPNGRMTEDEVQRPEMDLRLEASRVLAAAELANVTLRLMGGLAISRLCPSSGSPPLARTYADLDFVTLAKSGAQALDSLMKQLGYHADEVFNTIHGASRLYYYDRVNERHVDVFVDRMQMCHDLVFSERIKLMKSTLTPSDLLLTKLQIVQLNTKDILDVLALLHDIPVIEGAVHTLDPAFLQSVWGRDWALWRTCQLTLQKVEQEAQRLLPDVMLAVVLERIDRLNDVLRGGRKSLLWKLRAQVGDRVRWYELPEEVEA